MLLLLVSDVYEEVLYWEKFSPKPKFSIRLLFWIDQEIPIRDNSSFFEYFHHKGTLTLVRLVNEVSHLWSFAHVLNKKR